MRRLVVWAVGGAVVVVLGACAGPPVKEAPPPPPPKVREAPKPKPPPGQALSPREERRLVKELLRDVDNYYRLLKDKNVEQAVTYMPPEYRAKAIEDLWRFVARYQLESADVASYQLFVQPDGVLAKVRVVRTLFPKTSVIPERSEIWMTWMYTGGRWVLRPQREK